MAKIPIGRNHFISIEDYDKLWKFIEARLCLCCNKPQSLHCRCASKVKVPGVCNGCGGDAEYSPLPEEYQVLLDNNTKQRKSWSNENQRYEIEDGNG